MSRHHPARRGGTPPAQPIVIVERRRSDGIAYMKRRGAGTTSSLTGVFAQLNVTYSFHLGPGCEARPNGLRKQSGYFGQKWSAAASPMTNSQRSLPKLVSSSRRQASG